jgi:tRNA A37 N6-isopentenylltransferase MiaA
VSDGDLLVPILPKVAPHTAAQIEHANSRHAVRITELIDVTATRKPQYKGTGCHKRWVHDAMFRCCFGVRRKIGHRRSAPFAASLRLFVFALCREGSYGPLQAHPCCYP